MQRVILLNLLQQPQHPVAGIQHAKLFNIASLTPVTLRTLTSSSYLLT
jgi:hypothetical protein